jgi:hypothetical protein
MDAAEPSSLLVVIVALCAAARVTRAMTTSKRAQVVMWSGRCEASRTVRGEHMPCVASEVHLRAVEADGPATMHSAINAVG